MKKVRIKTSKAYDVIIGSGILKDTGNLLLNIIKPCRVVIVSDDRVSSLYSSIVSKSLEESGFNCLLYTFKEGEESKNINTLTELLEFLAQNTLTRGDLIIALGGGVTGDLAGFAASIYLRGISYVQIPTSILAAVDSSVGGKTAINLREGKNLAGAFYQPKLVICDTKTFDTLPENFFKDGLAEVIKYGVIRDKELFKIYAKGLKDNMEAIIERCIEIKGEIVAADEFDLGERQLLNFGHTIGHAIEKCSNFKINHGHGVAMGMVAAARASEAWGICTEPCSNELIDLLKLYGLPTELPYSPELLAEAALSDKKRNKDTLTLVLPERIGKCILHKIPVEKLQEFMALGKGNL